jgi:hypothetical protein
MAITTILTFYVIRYAWKMRFGPVRSGQLYLLRHRHRFLVQYAQVLSMGAGSS